MTTRHNAVQVKNLREVSDSITRPEDATAYTAGDVVSEVTTNDHFTFDTPLDGANSGEIEAALITSSANVGTKPDLELWLFHTDIAEVADNGTFAPTDTEMGYLIGVIDFATGNWKVGHSGADAAGNSFCHAVNQTLPFKLAASRKLYGQLVMRNAYVPVASEVFSVTLLIRQD